MNSLAEYRDILERIAPGTVSTDFALEIIAAAEAELAAAGQEYTIGRAMELTHRSRSWIRRRLPVWRESGLARQLEDGTCLINDAALPPSTPVLVGGVDLSLPVGAFADKLLRGAGR